MALNWFKKKKHSDEKKEEQDNSDSSEKTSFFERLKKGLSKTREILSTDIDELFIGKREIDDSLLEELEELLITSDIGVRTSMELIQKISKKSSKISDANQLKNALKEEMLSLLNLQTPKQIPEAASAKPRVIMVIGINGVGKTTTIGKLAAKFNSEGKKVLIAAADTFRAAAVEQLVIWADRADAQIVKHKDNADPASVAYDSIEAAIARGMDVVLVDTAGRLHTKVNLMEELKKIKRIISKKLAGAPHEILLVLDATTGQNALSQAKLFDDALGVTGIALTKLDGTAKGGVVVSICNTLKIQLKYIGIGENIDDLQGFNSKEFVDALF
ncbi:MAG: signal recognition particle-docking protein FtsY [Deltaproteobacteria bacterium]|jgi:fused signal recognition particle receptor|nr:signal recognition particle-docking protein FtsY [Deltaproteobacteria bacterium]